MAWYHWTLIGAALIALVAAWNVPRAATWILLGAALYVASAMWHVWGYPHGVVFGAATNFMMIALFWQFADTRWEMRLWNFYHLMLLVDALFLFGVIRDQFMFAATLELINLFALAFITTTGAMERIGGLSHGPADLGRAGGFHHALFAERASWSRPPWQR